MTANKIVPSDGARLNCEFKYRIRGSIPLHPVAAVAEWYRYRTVACFVTSSSPVPLKTRRVGQRCTLNLSRAETSSRWCGVVVRRGEVPAQVSSTSLDYGSKLRGPLPKSPRVAEQCDVNIQSINQSITSLRMIEIWEIWDQLNKEKYSSFSSNQSGITMVRRIMRLKDYLIYHWNNSSALQDVLG
ncbi:uncharacterized protein TNCV_1623081 [Trichonephila clavipes]|nr:uncharacterized protein TNCV_1623081 [Trichonephila clavipes]